MSVVMMRAEILAKKLGQLRRQRIEGRTASQQVSVL
jgi:hypothetical protein